MNTTPGGRLHVEIPLHLPSMPNQRLHHHARARQVAAQRDAVCAALKQKFAYLCPAVPCFVRVTRCAPRPLDPHDNLRTACKAVIDEVARLLGVDDRDPRVTWDVQQDKASASIVHIEVEWAEGGEVLEPLRRRQPAKKPPAHPETESTGARIRRLATSATYRPGGGKR